MTNHVGIWEALDSHLTCDCDLLIVEVDEFVGAMLMLSWGPSRLLVHLTRTELLETTDRARCVKVGRSSDGFLFGGHERIVRVVFVSCAPRLSRWNELDVVFLGSADVSYCLFS